MYIHTATRYLSIGYQQEPDEKKSTYKLLARLQQTSASASPAHGHSRSTDAPRLDSTITQSSSSFLLHFRTFIFVHPPQWPARAAGPRPGRSSEPHPAPPYHDPLEPPKQPPSSFPSSTHMRLPSGRPRHHAALAAQAREGSWEALEVPLGSRTACWALPRGYSRRPPRRPTIASRRRSARMTRSRG